MEIVCCQFNIVWEDKKANRARVESLLAAAQLSAGAMVVLPEMFATGFSMNIADIAEGDDGETSTFLAEQAQRWNIFLVGGLVTQGLSGRGRNQAVVFSPEGRKLRCYTKIHPFRAGGEGDHFEAGKQVVVFSVGSWMVAPFICYDLRFPEIFRLAVRQGMQIALVMANWPRKRIQQWVTLLQARAIENQVYVAGVNRCGQDPHLEYNGQSLIVSPNGEVLAQAGPGEEIIRAALEADLLQSLRTGLPFLQDMQSAYEAETLKLSFIGSSRESQPS